jgi:GNAT superfamily N-acetyltransferase
VTRVLPAVESDVPAMSRIMGAAFAADRHTMIKDLGRTHGTVADDMKPALTSWITGSARAAVLKAVDEHSGEILGWICWSRNYDIADDARPSQLAEPRRPIPAAPSAGNDEPDAMARLERLTNDDLARWQREVMPAGSRCRFVVAVAVSPAAQSRGVGAALISWGTSRADADNVFCWVHSSDIGRHVFSRAGFVELGHLTVDLDEFAPRPPVPVEQLDRWGTYTFRHMRRPAVGER